MSGSFIEQVTVFGFLVEPAYLINYDTLLPELEKIRMVHGNKTEIQALENNLQEYRDIFAIGNTRSNYHVRMFLKVLVIQEKTNSIDKNRLKNENY